MPRVTMPDGAVVDMPETLTPELATRLKALRDGGTAPKGVDAIPTGAPTGAVVPPSDRPVRPPAPPVDMRNDPLGRAQALHGMGEIAHRVGEKLEPIGNAMNALGPMAGGFGALETGLAKGVPAAIGAMRTMPAQAPKLLAGATADTVPLGRAALDVATPTLGKVTRAVTPKSLSQNNPYLVGLAEKAKAQGIPVRAAQLTDSGVANFVSDLVTGVKGDSKAAQIAANKAVAKELGVDSLPNGIFTKDLYGKQVTAIGREIGDLSSKNPVVLTADSPLAKKLNALMQDDRLDANLLTPEIKRIMSKAEADGSINGKKFAELQRVFRDKSYTASEELAPNLKALSDAMAAQIREGLSVTDRAAFDLANSRYSKAMALKSQMAKDTGRTGNIDFSALENFYGQSRQQYKTAMDVDSGLRNLTDIGKAFVEPKRVMPPVVKYGLGAAGVGLGGAYGINKVLP